MFSNMIKESNWKAPENIYVVKRAGIDYDQYWSDEKHRFGPLLEATIYTEMPEEIVKDSTVVNYREVIGLK